MHPLTVLFEDNHCLAVVKPARMLTVGDVTGDVALVDLARAYLRQKYHKPGNVFVGVVHRLDRPVSGIVLLARTSKGASRLSEQFRNRTVEKTYQAIVSGTPQPASGTWQDWLVKDPATNLVRVATPQKPQAQRAELSYRVLDRFPSRSLVEILLGTGRSHQIRVQLAHRGHPIYGDVKYGSPISFDHAIALHASQLTFTHPTREERITLTASLPESWQPWLMRKPAR